MEDPLLLQCIIIEKIYKHINALWWNREKGSRLIDSLGPATAKHQAPTHRLKLYVRAVFESEAWPNIVYLKVKP